MKKILSIILSAVILTSVFAVMPLTASARYIDSELRQNDEFEYYVYNDDGYVFIVEYLGKNPEVVIPDSIDGYPVEKLGSFVFEGCDFVTKITLPDTINTVQKDAFVDTALYNNDDNWEDGSLYIDSVLAAVDEEYEGEYKVREGTTAIADLAFIGCDKITSITIPGTVRFIPEKTFYRLESLKSLTLEEGVEEICDDAFANCSELVDINLPKSISRVGYQVFLGTEFYNNDYNWENGALYYKNILMTVDPECSGNFTVKDGTTVLADYSFDECNVENIYLPNGIKVLPFAFTNNCPWIQRVYLGNDLEELKSYSLSDPREVVLPDSVKKIGYRAFFQSRITEINLPENLEEIDVEAFLSCNKLKEISIPKNVKKIGYEALGYYMSAIDDEGYVTDKNGNLVIKGYPDTIAETYAADHDIEFVDLIKEALKTDINAISLTLDKETFVYTGKTIEPTVTVNGLKGETYTTEYLNNTDAGTASVVVTIKGRDGSISSIQKNFTVTKANNPLAVKTSNKKVKYSALKKKNLTLKPLKVSGSQGKLTYKKTSGNSKIKVNSANGKFTLKKGLKKKTYTVKVVVSAAGNANYNGAAKTVKLKIKVK